MFGNKKRDRKINELQDQLTEVRARLGMVEAVVEPIRVGSLLSTTLCSGGGRGGSWTVDHRSKLTLREAIQKIMAHLKIKFVEVSLVPASVEVRREK